MPKVSWQRMSREELVQAFRELMFQKKISAADIRISVERGRRIRKLEAELERLKAGSSGKKKVKKTATSKRKTKDTPKRKRSRKLQGQYMGRLKKFPDRDTYAEYRRLIKAKAKTHDVAAAVKLANRLIRKGKSTEGKPGSSKKKTQQKAKKTTKKK